MFPVLKRNADQTREQRENASAKAMTRALASYAIDNADKLVVASPPWSWVHNSAGATNYQMRPHDPLNPSRFLGGTVAKTFTPHLIDGRGVGLEELQVDPATYANFIAQHDPQRHRQSEHLRFHAVFGGGRVPLASLLRLQRRLRRRQLPARRA
ncbi:MAG: hypothetical protein QM783_04470 [Phycisphaerales bacterium]